MLWHGPILPGLQTCSGHAFVAFLDSAFFDVSDFCDVCPFFIWADFEVSKLSSCYYIVFGLKHESHRFLFQISKNKWVCFVSAFPFICEAYQEAVVTSYDRIRHLEAWQKSFRTRTDAMWAFLQHRVFEKIRRPHKQVAYVILCLRSEAQTNPWGWTWYEGFKDLLCPVYAM